MTIDELKQLCLGKGMGVSRIPVDLQWKPGVVVTIPYGDKRLKEFEENPELRVGPSGRGHTIIEIEGL